MILARARHLDALTQAVSHVEAAAGHLDPVHPALELFAEKGFSATRMDDVAARAGLSKAGVYLYFKDKTALLKALVEEMAGANVAVARGIVEAHQGPVSPLIATILAFLGGQVRHTRFPELIKIVISESRAHPEVGQLYLESVVGQGLPLFAVCGLLAYVVQWVVFVPSFIAHTAHYFDLTGSITYLSLTLLALFAGNSDPRALVIGERHDAAEGLQRGAHIGRVLGNEKGTPVQPVAGDDAAVAVQHAAARRREEAGGEAVFLGDCSLENERLEFRPRCVDGRRPTGRAAADDDDVRQADPAPHGPGQRQALDGRPPSPSGRRR